MDISGNEYGLMQANGCIVYGPPEDWCGPQPDSSCELYIRHIPKTIGCEKILEPFVRFGKVYQFRVPIDFSNRIRGYAYVRYTNEQDANIAMEVLNHFFIEPSVRLNIVKSCEKSRLFVKNIPKHLAENEIEKQLRTVFPSMQSIKFKGSTGAKSFHVGYVFVNFATHNDALNAKKSCCPGIIRLWGQDLKVVWANTESFENQDTNKTLLVRNVDLKLNTRVLLEEIVKYVNRTNIKKISKDRTNIFFNFTSHQAAETVLNKMQGAAFYKSEIAIEWAKPSDHQSIHRMRNIDYDNALRIKCIANMWYIPVIIFGTYFEKEDIQYAAVLLRNSECALRFIICTLECRDLIDIHSRFCEVVVELINKIGGFPDCNYVFSVKSDIAHMLGMIPENPQMDFVASSGVPKEHHVDLIEIFEISYACSLLAKFPEEEIMQDYKNSLSAHSTYTYLTLCGLSQRVFGSIMPTYRNKPPLNCNRKDTQIVLALCYRQTGTNSTFMGRNYTASEVSGFDYKIDGLPYTEIALLPLPIAQSRYASNLFLKKVQFGQVGQYQATTSN